MGQVQYGVVIVMRKNFRYGVIDTFWVHRLAISSCCFHRRALFQKIFHATATPAY